MARGDNHVLALTTTTDEITGEVKPLFSFPVQVCKATGDGDEVKFDNAAPSGAPYEVKYLDTGTGEMFEYADRLRGIRIGDEFRAIDPEAIAAIDEVTAIKTMVVEGKAPLDDVWREYGERVVGVYFLQSPAKGGMPTAYRLVYEALLPQKKGQKVVTPATALVVKRTARTRQKVAWIYADPIRECLMMVEARFAAQMRAPDAQVQAPMAAKVTHEQINMARKVIAEKLGDGLVALAEAQDEALALRADLVEMALAGEGIDPTPIIVDKPTGGDPMDALMASLAA